MDFSFLINKAGQKLAYIYSPANSEIAEVKPKPTVMFLGGFKSDMSGTKSLFLEELCRSIGISFVRFDYSGHGISEGSFEEGTIGSWIDDSILILEQVVKGEVILVGSSMGGWIALKLLMLYPERVKGVIGIAAAPDFTQEIEPRMSIAQREEMAITGKITVLSGYEEPYIYTKDLIEDGKKHLVLDCRHNISAPLILLQGKLDDAVPLETALKIKEYFIGSKTKVVLIEDGDHRLSRPVDLERLKCSLESLI